MPVDNIIPSPT